MIQSSQMWIPYSSCHTNFKKPFYCNKNILIHKQNKATSPKTTCKAVSKTFPKWILDMLHFCTFTPLSWQWINIKIPRFSTHFAFPAIAQRSWRGAFLGKSVCSPWWYYYAENNNNNNNKCIEKNNACTIPFPFILATDDGSHAWLTWIKWKWSNYAKTFQKGMADLIMCTLIPCLPICLCSSSL